MLVDLHHALPAAYTLARPAPILEAPLVYRIDPATLPPRLPAAPEPLQLVCR